MQVGGEDLAIGTDSTIMAAISQLDCGLLQSRPGGHASMNFITGYRCRPKAQCAGNISQLLLGFEHRGIVEQAEPLA